MTGELLPIVARCARCGREYVWMPPDGDWLDHYGIRDGQKCCGRIEPVDTDPPSNAQSSGRG